MKQKLLLLLLAAFAAISANARDFTYTYEGQTLTYTVIDEAAKTVRTKAGFEYMCGNDISGNLILPAHPKSEGSTYTLTEIGEYSFGEHYGSSFSGPSSVIIPNSVTTIGDFAFSWCNDLITARIPESVTDIGSRAFASCSSMQHINVDNGNKQYCSLDGVLFNSQQTTLLQYPCGRSGAYTIPSSVTTISEKAFFRCNDLTSVIIPNSVTTIEAAAFSYCNNLSSVSMSTSVTYIGSCAFGDCSSLTSLTIPSSLTILDLSAFINCNGITELYYNAENLTIDYQVNESPFPSSIEAIEIGDRVKRLPRNIFSDLVKVASVTIPNSVTEIGSGAFSGCTSLTSVNIPNSVTKIGGGAFSDCTSLTSVNIPNSVTEIGESPFYGCNNLKTLYYYAEDLSFDGTWRESPFPLSIETIELGDDVKKLPRYIFAGLKAVTSVIIPNSVTEIGDYAFLECGGLSSVTIGNSVKIIGTAAFRDCGIIYLTIPTSVTEISTGAFYNCSGLTTIALPKSLKKIGANVWELCKNIESIEYAAEIPIAAEQNIFEQTVYDNAELIVPKTSIKRYRTTEPWQNFENITYSGQNFSYTYMDQTIEYTVIDDMTCETKHSDSWTAANNVSGDVKIPMKVSDGENSYMVTEIGKRSFIKSDISSIELPSSIVVIEEGAFAYCDNLCAINLPKNLEEIGECAFWLCEGLTSIEIPRSVTVIGESAFDDCSALETVTLSANLTEIGDYAFGDCPNIRTVTYPAKEPCSADAELFSQEVYDNAELIVPKMAIMKYRETEPWMYFKKIKGSSFSGLDIAEIDCADAPAEVYTLGGVKIGNTTEGLLPGVYIVRKGSTTEKIIKTK